jgi:hypothetical protein
MACFGTLDSIRAKPHGMRISNWPIELIVDLLESDFGDYEVVSDSSDTAHWSYADVDVYMESHGPNGPYEDMVSLSIIAR